MKALGQKANTWQPPTELQRSTPREVQLTGTGKAAVVAMIVLVLTAVGGAIALATKAADDERRWANWSAEAASTGGQITGLRKRGSGDNTKYYVDYSYEVNGTNYAATGNVRSGEWRRMNQGTTLMVFYRRSAPGTCWLPGHEPKGVAWFAAPLFALSLMIPVPILVYAIRRQRRLLEEGRATQATVTSKKLHVRDRGRNHAIEYEFRTIEGARRTGKYNVNRKPPEVGDTLIVLYHPDEERWSARYPLCLVRVREF